MDVAVWSPLWGPRAGSDRGPHPTLCSLQLSMLFTEECDKVRDLMHVHSFSYDFHLRVVHQYLEGCHAILRSGYQLTDFLDDFIANHPDIPKFGRNHVFQGDLRCPLSCQSVLGFLGPPVSGRGHFLIG